MLVREVPIGKRFRFLDYPLVPKEVVCIRIAGGYHLEKAYYLRCDTWYTYAVCMLKHTAKVEVID